VSKDRANTTDLGRAIAEITPALETFYRFEGEDLAARRRSEWRAALDGPLPAQGAGLDAVTKILRDVVVPNGLRNGAPGFAGWITTSPTTSAVAASLAATVAGSQRWWVQPFNHLETVALRWLSELLGLPGDIQGTFCGGGSTANIIALGAARQHAFERLGVDPAKDGLPSRQWRVYASSEVHHVVTRAAAILGLGRRNVRVIATDAELRMDVSALRRALDEDARAGIHPVAIVATAGTVNTGAIDPIAELLAIARERGIWLHVDGAYGAFGVLDPRVAPLFKGMEEADSIAVDPHKWLAAPLGTGAVFARDRAGLGRAFTLEPAEYLEGAAAAGEPRSPFDDFGDAYHDFNLDQSAPSRGAAVWAVLLEIGAEGMRERVVRHLDFARRVAELARADARLEVLSEPVLSICCFRYRVPGRDDTALNALNARIAQGLRAETPFVPSTTVVTGRFAIRPCFINPRTTMADVEGMVAAVRRIGDELAG
jgi:aromatic-L-amino-acid/L-tryptophan decarboxylase